MILSRQEFAEHFNSLDSRLGVDGSPLWIPDGNLPSQWFICVKPIPINSQITKKEYYLWCHDTLNGIVRCYSSNDVANEEWWGFTDKEDIVLWTLKWT